MRETLRWWAWLTVLAMLGCDAEVSGNDAGGADAGHCATACDDGLFCNGAERCEPGDPGADVEGCVAGTPPCATECDEAVDACLRSCTTDADGDGHLSLECGGDDCDDAEPLRYAGATEVCDIAHLDEDCDARTFGVRDADGDGYPDRLCCNDDGGVLRCGDDCDDSHSNQHPGLAETCDGLDNDCDGSVDEAVGLVFYVDADGDGYGSPDGEPVMGCAAPPGYALGESDCDDGAPAVHPGALEQCDLAMVDEDCDGVANPVSLCTCSGDITRPCMREGACASGTERCIGGSWGGCSIAPVSEACNAIDDDCDGTTDEGLATRECYPDLDRDGWVDLDAMPIVACLCPAGTDIATGSVGDCDDTDRIVNPGQTAFFAFESLSHGWDYDCNGTEELEHTRFGDMCNFSPMCSSPGCSPLPHYPGESAADLPGCGVGARQFTCTCYEDVDFTACINQAPSVMVTQRCR